MIRALLLALPLSWAAPALACDYPDEGNMPLRRAVTRVQMLPDTDRWQKERIKDGEAVLYRLFLDRPVHVDGRCYWTVEAVAGGKVWQRFYVTPDGKSVRAGAAPR